MVGGREEGKGDEEVERRSQGSEKRWEETR